jgi:4-amino-4-deoxy-L-arabinose transferase-like glycosyltransferase
MSLGELASRRPRALVLTLAAVVAFSFQGSRGLYETTEGRYAQSALEMLQSGRYLEPTLAGRPHWTKPPVAYWAIAAGVWLAGANGWGARLSNAVVFCATVLVVAAIGTALWDAVTGVLAGLVYLSSPFPAGAASVVSTDTLLAFWEILAVYLYVRAWRQEDDRRARWWIRAMWLAWGLAFLTKGPAGLLPLLALIVLGRVSRRRVRLAEPLGIAAFAVVAFSWYAWAALRHPGLLRYFVGDEVIGRTVSDEFHRNPQWWKPFVVYLPFLVLGQGAWLLAGARVVGRERLASPRALLARVRRGDQGSLLVLWLLLPLAVLWLSSSRLPLYVLPLFAPIALGIARALAKGGPLRERRALAVAGVSAAVIVLLKAASAHAAPPSEKDMGRLLAAARGEAGPAARYRVFGEDRLYGLQFYLNGALRRVSAAGTEPWADQRLDEALAEVTRAPGTTYVFVSTPGATPSLESALGGAGLTFRHVRADRRDLLVVGSPARADVRTLP